MNAHDLGGGRARRQQDVNNPPFAVESNQRELRSPSGLAFSPILGGPAVGRPGQNGHTAEDKKDALRRERQAEYQALLVRKGMQPMKQQVSQNPPNAGGGGISGGPQLSAADMKKKAYREELEAQINAKKEKARAEKEADRRPVMQPSGPLGGGPAPPPFHPSGMRGGGSPSQAPRMAAMYAPEPQQAFISPPRQREPPPQMGYGGGYGGGGGGVSFADEPPQMGGYGGGGGYGPPQMAPPPMYYQQQQQRPMVPPLQLQQQMAPGGGYGAPPPYDGGGGYGGGYGYGPGPGMGGPGGYGGGGGYGGPDPNPYGGGGGMPYRRSSPPAVISSEEAAAFTRAKPSMPWEQGSSNSNAGGQRPRGTGLQELKGGAPPVDMDRKAAYRRELEVQIREQQARRDVQKLEAKGLDGFVVRQPEAPPPMDISPGGMQPGMDGMDLKQIRQMQYQQELKRQADEQKAVKDEQRRRIKAEELAAEAKLKAEQDKLRMQYEAEQAKERQKVEKAVADADAQREAALKGRLPPEKRQRTPSAAGEPAQKAPEVPAAGKPPTPKVATPKAATPKVATPQAAGGGGGGGGPVDSSELNRLRNELAAEQEKLRKVVEDQMRDLKALRDKAEHERVEHADVMRKLEDIRMEVKREMPRDHRGGRYDRPQDKREQPPPYGDALRDANRRLARAPPEVALAACVSPAPSLMNAPRAAAGRNRARGTALNSSLP